MPTMRLRIGFPESTPPEQALSEAIRDWHEAVTRAGHEAVGIPSAEVITHDPERSAMGEYVIVVSGERTDGDV